MKNSPLASISDRKMMLLLSILVYTLLFIGTLNWYRHFFDTDGVAYMTIAKRVASFDFIRSINGLWSPLNNWIAAPFSGFSDYYPIIYKWINAFTSVGVIVMVYLIMKRFVQSVIVLGLTLLILPVILLSYTHIQLAGDLLQLFLFLIYFYLISTKGFFSSSRYNILAAVVMFLAYLAKSFSLPFFFIQYTSIYLLFAWFNKANLKTERFIKPFLYGISIFTVLSLSWAICLYFKYDKLMFSAAGTLNYNWMIGREQAVIPGNQFFIPPPYEDSPGYWEDPYGYYENFIGPFSSFTFFVRTCKLILTNTKTALFCLLDISFLSYTIFFFLLLFLFLKKIKIQFFNVIAIIWTSIVVIGGYLLIHVETRYYWPVAILLLISGGYLIEHFLFPLIKQRLLKVAFVLLFAFSFVFSPIYALKDMKGSGKDLYEASSFLKKNNIKGNFGGNYTGASLNSWYLKLAYLSGTNLHILRKVNFTQEELLQGINKNQLDFFIYSYGTEMEKQLFLKGEVAKAAGLVLQIPNQNKLVLMFSPNK